MSGIINIHNTGCLAMPEHNKSKLPSHSVLQLRVHVGNIVEELPTLMFIYEALICKGKKGT